jgi:hypothetical protein
MAPLIQTAQSLRRFTWQLQIAEPKTRVEARISAQKLVVENDVEK